jgi:hypothetical protein
MLVANQNGKKLERIETDYDRDIFEQQPVATIDLASCTTPNGLPCQDSVGRPYNAAICPFVPQTGYPAYMSLRGGGMLVVNPYSTPMSIVAEYDSPTIPRDGCGGVRSPTDRATRPTRRRARSSRTTTACRATHTA